MNAKSMLALGLVATIGGAAFEPAAPSTRPAPATRDIVIEGSSKGILLTELIELARSATGEPFFFVPQDVEDQRVVFLGTVRLPRERFLSFLDHCLRANDFLRLGLQARGQQAFKTQARIVTREELAAVADRCELVTTAYAAKNVPHRGFDHCVCVYFSDSSIQSVRSIEGTNLLLMTGVACEVESRIRMMERLDAELGAPRSPGEK